MDIKRWSHVPEKIKVSGLFVEKTKESRFVRKGDVFGTFIVEDIIIARLTFVYPS